MNDILGLIRLSIQFTQGETEKNLLTLAVDNRKTFCRFEAKDVNFNEEFF